MHNYDKWWCGGSVRWSVYVVSLIPMMTPRFEDTNYPTLAFRRMFKDKASPSPLNLDRFDQFEKIVGGW